MSEIFNQETTVDCISLTPDDTRKLGRSLGERLPAGSVLALDGSLGAGKTTLTAGLAEGLGNVEETSSPTFTILHEYIHPDARLPLYHFDVYRLSDAAEFQSAGLDEYFNYNGICVIEWAKRIQPLLPERTIFVQLERSAEEAAGLVAEKSDGTVELFEDKLPRRIQFKGSVDEISIVKSALIAAGLGSVN
ncbi:MAG: tRNA (adenosine(37)-N6)-threonylcarbamoyltransferase complex ATPase subunit type 1 TsaE [Fastidiosipilaceae bacterium]|jgi:tRNA threonylcarbamoyladenosine biosynthesis protein TsaE